MFASSQVVGHTIQEQGINSACGEKVFRIDVGLSKGCGNGEPEVSEPDSSFDVLFDMQSEHTDYSMTEISYCFQCHI